jgi:hypothetical protein
MTDPQSLMDDFLASVVFVDPVDNWRSADTWDDPDDGDEPVEKAGPKDEARDPLGRWTAGLRGLVANNVKPSSVGLDYSLLPRSGMAAERKKYARKTADLYKTNKTYRKLADALSLYTQGYFEPMIRAAGAIATNRVEQWLESEAKARARKPEAYASGKGFLTMYGVLDDLKNINGEHMEGGSINVKQAIEQAKLVVQAIADSPVTDTPVFRGDKYRRSMVAETLEGTLEKASARRIKEARADLKEAQDYLAAAPNAVERKYGKEEVERKQISLDSEIAKADRAKRRAKTLTVGAEFDAPILSFSYDEEVADGFAEGNVRGASQRRGPSESAILFKLVGKHNGLDVAAFSPWKQAETLTGGRFRVKSVKAGYNNDSVEVELEQVGTYAPA